MLKSVVLCILMWHEMGEFSSDAENTTVASMPLVSTNPTVPQPTTVACSQSVYTVHRNLETWGKARLLCSLSRAHLATINSEAEEKILVRKMAVAMVNEAWIGYHDQFAEDDWISVFDEMLNNTVWNRWTELWPNVPDDGGKHNQNCGALIRRGGGMDDQSCDTRKAYICKQST